LAAKLRLDRPKGPVPCARDEVYAFIKVGQVQLFANICRDLAQCPNILKLSLIFWARLEVELRQAFENSAFLNLRWKPLRLLPEIVPRVAALYEQVRSHLSVKADMEAPCRLSDEACRSLAPKLYELSYHIEWGKSGALTKRSHSHLRGVSAGGSVRSLVRIQRAEVALQQLAIDMRLGDTQLLRVIARGTPDPAAFLAMSEEQQDEVIDEILRSDKLWPS
jgi:hypothetical protein